MKKNVVFLLVGAIFAAILVIALIPHSSKETAAEATPVPPVVLAVSTPLTPLPSPGEMVLDVSSELSYDAVQVCAGSAIRFRNRQPAPVILEARDHSFSSGVLQPGGEFATVLSAPGTIEVMASSPVGSKINEYRVEVVECGER